MDYNKSIMIFSRTLHNRPDLHGLFDYKVNPTPGAIQLDYHYFVL